MNANEIMQAFDKQYGSAAILPTIALFAGIAIGVIGIVGLIVSLIGKGKTAGIGKISSVLAPIELILGIISLLAFAGVTAIILLGTNGITEPNDLFYGFAYTPAKFGMPISENGPIDTIVIITYAIVFALPALLCLGAAVVGFIGKSKAKKAAADITAQPQFAMNAMNGQPMPQPNMAQQPAPQPDMAQQPAPQPNMAQQPVPQPNMAQQPVPQPNMAQQPVPQPDMAQQPVPQPNMAQQPVPQPDMAQQPAPQPDTARQPAPQPDTARQPAPKKDTISCPVCGNELEADRTFCTKCGVKLALADEDDDNIPSAPVDNSAQTDADIINETQPNDNIITAAPIAAEPAPAVEEDSIPTEKLNATAPVETELPAPETAPVVEAVPTETPNTTAPAEDYSGYFDAPETAPENNIGTHICAVCGNALNENSAFCTKCGTPVNAQPAPEVAPATEVTPTETPNTTTPEEDYSGYFDAPEVAPASEPAPESIGGHICAVCGNVLNENSAFCTKCGTPVNAQPAPETAPAEVAPAAEAVPNDTPSANAPEEDYSGYFDVPETAPTSEPAPENNIGAHICAVCGNVLNENSAFCTKCGTPVNSQPAPEVAPATEAIPTETPNTTAPEEDYSGYFDAPEVAPTSEPAPESIGAHICAVCGNVLNENSAFCTKCGTPVNSQPAPEAEVTPTEAPNATSPEEDYSGYFDAPETAPASEPAPESIGAHVCAVCGNVLNENSAFCTKCGTPVNAQPAPEVTPTTEAEPTDTTNTTTPAEDYSGYFDAPEVAPANEPSPENNGTRFCVVCGNVLNENSAFCTKCGTPVNAQPAPEVAPTTEAIPTDTPNTTTPAEDYSGYFDAPETSPTSEPAPENNIGGGHICAVCGNVLNENSAFCTKCGTPVNAQPTPEAEVTPTEAPNATSPEEDYSGYFDAPETAPASEPAPENNIGGHICAVCGNVLNENSTFCTKCGTPVNAQPAPEVAPTTEAEPTDTTNTTTTAEDYSGYFDAPETAPASEPAPENNIGGHICTVCGNVLNENSAFCTKCGTPVNAQPAPEVAPAIEVTPTETPNTTTPEEDYSNYFDAPEVTPAVEAVPTEAPNTTSPAEDYSGYFDAPEPAPENNIGAHICAVCGNVLNENSAFCTKCGTPVSAQPASEIAPASEPVSENNIGTHICVVCGNVLNENSAFCTKCGTPVNAQPIPETVSASEPAPAVEAVPTDTPNTTAPAEYYSGYFDAPEPAPASEPIPENNSTRFCVICGNVLNENSAFCTKCGTPTIAASDNSITCPCCNAKLTSGTKFCIKCGTKIQ